MTSLPPNQPKIPLGNPRNSEAVPFFQSSKGHSPTPAQSFDSLIPKNESKKSRNDELEEAEAARKRKKTAPPTEAASSASTSPTDPFAPITTTPDIASPLLAAKPNDLSIQLPPESRQTQATKVDEKADPSSTLATQKGTNAPISDNASLSAIDNSPGDAPTLNPEPLAAETLPSSREAASSASTSQSDPFAPITTKPVIASPPLAAKPNDLSIQLPPESRQTQATKVDEKADPSSTLATQKGTNAPISDNASLSAINNSPGDAPTLNPEPLAAETLPSSRELF